MSDLADYAWLTGNTAALLLEECLVDQAPLHRQLQRLRKVLSPQQAGLVVELTSLRRRAETKFGRLASKMFFTELALQQATDLWTASYKASRLKNDQPVHDYCCGLGGDLMALARRGPAVGWDRSAEMAHLATANLDVLGASEHSQVRVQEIEAMAPLPGEVWHLDPDRRSSGRRSTQMEWHSPGPEFIEHLRKIAPDGVLKLAPATEVPEPWNQEAEREWISWNRQCRQQVIWFGALAQQSCLRRATVVTKTANCLEDPRVHSFVGQSTTRAPQGSQVEEYIYDIDPAVRAAGLTGALARDQNLVALEKESGYLTSAIFCGHPLLTGFQVLDVLPLRVKSLSSFLRKQSIGRLEIKKRGIETDPEQLRQKLKLQGEESRTLLLTRLGEREIAILAQRCLDGVTGSSLKD